MHKMILFRKTTRMGNLIELGLVQFMILLFTNPLLNPNRFFPPKALDRAICLYTTPDIMETNYLSNKFTFYGFAVSLPTIAIAIPISV